MALTIENPEAARLAKELAEQTGESVDEVVLHALKYAMLTKQRARVGQRLEQGPVQFPRSTSEFTEAVKRVQDKVAKLPVLDDRSADELLGYDDSGLPH